MTRELVAIAKLGNQAVTIPKHKWAKISPVISSRHLASLSLIAAIVAVVPDATPSPADSVQATRAFPAKPVRIVVPLAPGGGSDIVARIVAQGLTETWRHTVVVDNRPGAGSTVGTAIAARAPADGYTLLVSSSSIAISPALYKNLDFDIRRDFSAVTLIASQPSMLAVHSSVPAQSVKDLIAIARSQPGKFSYGSAGVGSATHLGAELLKFANGIDLLHVPYKSAGLATSALLAGEVHLLLTNMASVLPHVKSGRVRALAVSSPARHASAPEVPTISESGTPGFEYATWYGMLVPSATNRHIVVQIQKAVAETLKRPALRDRMTTQGLDVLTTTTEQFGRYLAAEIARWDKVIRSAGIKAE